MLLNTEFINIPIIIVLIIASIVFWRIIEFIRKKRKRNLEEKSKRSVNNRIKPICKETESCWCLEYHLSEEERIKVLEQIGDEYCGKTASSVVNH